MKGLERVLTIVILIAMTCMMTFVYYNLSGLLSRLAFGIGGTP